MRGSLAPELEAREIRTSFVQRLPGGRRRHYRHYLPLFPAAAASLDLAGYDLVISSSHCVAKGVRVPRARCTSATATRPCGTCGTATTTTSALARASAPVRAGRRRWWPRACAPGTWPPPPRVHHFAANSAYVAGRIRRYYGRDAEVIAPPVDTDFFTPGRRTAPATTTWWSPRSCPTSGWSWCSTPTAGTGRPLKIVGTGPEERAPARRRCPARWRFWGAWTTRRLRELYRGCRAVIMAGVEDFGIVPLEAMACGRPAVVFAEGGGLETVVPGETGLVFHEDSLTALRAAIDSLQGLRFNTAALRARAEAFSRPAFETRFRDFVERALEDAARTPGAAP